MMGPKQARLGGRRSQTQHCSRLSEMKIRDATKGVYILQGFRELAGRIRKDGVDFASPEQILGGWRPVRECRLGCADRILVRVGGEIAPLRPAETHEALIPDDLCDPRLELGFASKTLEVLECG